MPMLSPLSKPEAFPQHVASDKYENQNCVCVMTGINDKVSTNTRVCDYLRSP